ncbi:fluoride efflux transporter CrcB [Aquirhabdus parva]|uniref:Fluoride-specific ion channel FluC n=1 Tax=Aquirhabdus parva TaxID=2283318 RepID=A0A345P4N9_9GAMM|nr:fluoride efflux transporter CrcB [Aquirhabdus parva]AXI02248.1 fluoride efflux transporter CrcB [Aquirhabdus parva]
MQWILVSIGAALGAMLRLFFAQMLNAVHPAIPYGTLLANVLGGFLMGLVLASTQQLSTEMRLLLATGFLGGLTTFSTFSAESFTLLNNGRVGMAFFLIGLHVIGSIAATALGFYLVNAIKAL